MDISSCSSSSTTTDRHLLSWLSLSPSLSPSFPFSSFYFYYARLSRHSPRNIPPRRCTDLLLLVFSFRPFYPRVGPRACNIPRYVRQNNRLGKRKGRKEGRNERTSEPRPPHTGEGEGETCENEITRLDRNASREE
jgi:hypothetical protein